MEIKRNDNRRTFQEILWLFAILIGLLIGYYCFSSWTNAPIVEEQSLVDNLSRELTLKELLATHKDKLIFLSVNDDAATKLSKEIRDFFKDKNGETLSQLTHRSSYAGIYENGTFLQEKTHQNEVASLTYKDIIVSSGGFASGSFSRLEIAGKTVNSLKRGLNVFIIEPATERVLNYAFDFFARETPLSKGETHYTNQLEQITITLTEADYDRLQQKRAAALEAKVLLTCEADLVPAKIAFQDQLIKSDIRLKGDWTDHLIGDNWSFRVKLAKNKTVLGMRKFSLHHPKTRNYAGEWLFHQLLKAEGILSLQYHFVKVQLKVESPTNTISKDLGIYALEEFFDKYLICLLYTSPSPRD